MESNRFWDEVSPKIYELQILRKITYQHCNQHIAMCPCIKFQSILRTLDFAQTCPKLNEWQNFEKLNVNIIISMQKCAPVPNFNQFGELQTLRPNLPKNMNDKNFVKVNIKIEISI